jgi:hypothetical protein
MGAGDCSLRIVWNPKEDFLPASENDTVGLLCRGEIQLISSGPSWGSRKVELNEISWKCWISCTSAGRDIRLSEECGQEVASERNRVLGWVSLVGQAGTSSGALMCLSMTLMTFGISCCQSNKRRRRYISSPHDYASIDLLHLVLLEWSRWKLRGYQPRRFRLKLR